MTMLFSDHHLYSSYQCHTLNKSERFSTFCSFFIFYHSFFFFFLFAGERRGGERKVKEEIWFWMATILETNYLGIFFFLPVFFVFLPHSVLFSSRQFFVCYIPSFLNFLFSILIFISQLNILFVNNLTLFLQMKMLVFYQLMFKVLFFFCANCQLMKRVVPFSS